MLREFLGALQNQASWDRSRNYGRMAVMNVSAKRITVKHDSRLIPLRVISGQPNKLWPRHHNKPLNCSSSTQLWLDAQTVARVMVSLHQILFMNIVILASGTTFLTHWSLGNRNSIFYWWNILARYSMTPLSNEKHIHARGRRLCVPGDCQTQLP